MFRAVIVPLQETELPVQHFDLYTGRVRCNLLFNALGDHIFRETTTFERVYLDDMWEHDLLHFEVAGGPKCAFLGNPIGPHEIVAEGKEVQNPLRYRFPSDRPAGSPQLQRCMQERRVERGPLDRWD